MSVKKENLLDLGLLWLRILMGVGIAHHGFGKVFGGNIEGFAQGVAKLGFPVPIVFAWLSALAEFAGGILVAIGFQTRIAALFVFINMSVAAFMQHAADPLKVKELALCYWVMAGTLILTGGGKFSFKRRGN
ncbi:MAG: DoxX family protein [Candidatus Omnitrophica bacterium]|nr:DoxX family protein [Candidatus Omnitrophota bacterium]